MAETHVVQELQFEIAFDDEEQAWDTQQRASDFVQQRALAIVEEAFDELRAAGRVLRVASLELDLGAVDPDQLEIQWAERLREQLRLALARLDSGAIRESGGTPTAEGASWQSREQAELEALVHFLCRGRLSWGVPASTDPRELGQRVWQHSAGLLVQALHRIPYTAQLAARLEQQFEPAWLQALEKALSPAAPASPWPRAAAEVQRRLQRALSGPGAAQSASTPRRPGARDDGDPLLAPAGTARADLRRLRALLTDDAPALSEEDLHELLALWHRLERQDPAGLRHTLAQSGARVRVRRRMARLWPQALLQRVPALWWGDVDSPPRQARQGPASTGTEEPGTAVAGGDRRARWERALAQLFLDDGVGLRAETAAGPAAAAPAIAQSRPSAVVVALLQQLDAAVPPPTQVSAAVRHQARVAEALARRWPARDAVVLADLACQPLPRAWQADDAPEATREQRVQWALQLASSAEAAAVGAEREGMTMRASDPAPVRRVAQAWWLMLALQQGRSPVALWSAIQAPPASAASPPDRLDLGLAPDLDEARCRAWRQFLPAAAGLPGVVLAALQSLAATRPEDSRALSAAASQLVRAVAASQSADTAASMHDIGSALQGELAALLDSERTRAQWAAAFDARAWHDWMTLWTPAEEARQLSADWARAAATDPSLLHRHRSDWLAAASSQRHPAVTLPMGRPTEAAAASQRSTQRWRLRRELWSAIETPAARAAFLESLDEAAWLRVLGLSLPAPEAALLDAALEELSLQWRGRASGAPALDTAALKLPLKLRLREQAVLSLAWTPRLMASVPAAAGTLGPAAQQALVQAARWSAWFHGIGQGLSPAHELASGSVRSPVGLGALGPPTQGKGPGWDAELRAAVASLRGADEVHAAAWLRLVRSGVAPLRDAPSAQQVLAHELEVPLAAQRLAAALEPAALLQVLQWLRPTDAAALQALWPRLQGAAEPEPSAWAQRARAVLRELFEEGRALDPDALMRRVDAVAAVQAAAASAASWTPSPSGAAEQPWLVEHPDEPLFIGNAGLVLATPYLPRLFEMLGLVRDKAFTGPDAAARAVLLCECLVSGEASAPEPLLALNKLVCGLPLAAPVPRAIELLPKEREAIEGLLQALIAHWTALGKTSVAGLRQTFLQREGRLEHSDEAWQLQVQPQTFDMLLDRLPWGYTPVRFPWMPEVLHVHWR